MDDRGTGDIRENTDESLRPRKNRVFSTDDPNSISRIRGLKQDYDPFLYGEDEELAKNKETLSNLISDRANGKENMLPRDKARFITTDMYADESEKEYKDRLYDNDMYYRNPEGTENMFDDEPGYNEPYEVNESRLKDLVMETAKKVLKEMDELSPKLLQNAADTAWDRGRYSQAENFESEAGARASSEFGGDDNIRRITAKNIACVSPDGSAWSISRDGSYYFRPKSGYNNESGHLTGMTKFPDYMKTDKHTARTIVKWWQKYNNADAEIPFMNDWHELVKW